MNKIVYSLVNYCKQDKYGKVNKLLNNKKDSLTWQEYFILSSLHFGKKNPDKKSSYTKKIVEILPNSKFAYNNLGNFYLNTNKINLAIKYYKKSISKKENEINLFQPLKFFFKKISKYKKLTNLKNNKEEVLNKILDDIEDIRDRLSLRQIITVGRPHFSELYNKIEILIFDIDEIYKQIKKCKRKKNIKLVLKKNIYKIRQLKKKFQLISNLNADYENPYFNLARCYLKKKLYTSSIKYFYLANKYDNSKKYNNRILEVFYISNKKQKFINFVKKIKKQRKIDFNSLAISNFVCEQWNIKNQYNFCDNPINFIYKNNILNKKYLDLKFLKLVEMEIKKNRSRIYTPVVIGHKSTGNLFENKTSNIQKLKKTIQKNIIVYKKKYLNENNLMINRFPKKYNLNAWFISLKKGGEVKSHIHDGWLSGVFYLKRPKQKNFFKGDIELTSRFKKLPLLKNKQNKKILKIKPGDLLLFPSSLPHRVIPFNMSKERLCIAFDMKPLN